MRLRFILIFGNKLTHSYNHDFNYHPNLQHRTIHSTIYSDDWPVNKKNTYNNIRNGRKNWSRLCGNGNATSHGSLWGGKKTGLSPVNGLIQQPKLFNKYYISFFGINILSVNMWGKLYRKFSLNAANIQPTGITTGEDLAFNLQLFPYLSKIYILKECGYNYRFGGMTTRYNTCLLPDLKKLYYIKKALIDKYQYHKASDYIRIELKNVLKSDICQMIAFKVRSPKEIKNRISEELKDPIYKDIMQVQNHPAFLEDPFIKAIAAYDSNMRYDLCKKQVKKEIPIRLLKKIISFILIHI